MGLASQAITTLLTLLYRGEANRFYRNLHRVEEVQWELLQSILSKNKDTDFGKKHRFADISSREEYERSVPISDYGDYIDYIERMAKGEQNVLTAEKVAMFEITGGSGGASKLIPYTAGLKQEFLYGTKPWLYRLFTDYPSLRRGKSYWSITPPTHETKVTSGGIPIGFEEDTAYFGKIERFLTDFVLVRDKSLREPSDMQTFYRNTSLALLSEKDLTLISVWNPSYLLLILDYMTANADMLLPLLPKKRQGIAPFLKIRDFESIWPRLSLISCWCDGAAADGAKTVREIFQNVSIQPKGILSTEAFMTIPHGFRPLSILSYRSHYFEFLNMKSKKLFRYTELEKGECYEIIFTTSGGFYRYKINDIVMAEEMDDATGLPLLRFMGRSDKTADYHGEKLNELFVKDVLNRLKIQNFENRFCLVAYEDGRYVLFLEDGDDALPLAEHFDELLCEGYHYKLCRDLGQLKQAEICPIYGDVRSGYLNFYLAKGRKLGDIKPETLSLQSGFGNFFNREKD